MRVLFLTWRDRTHPDGGGSEVYVEEVAGRLAALGHEVTVLCPRHSSLTSTQLRDGVRMLPRGGRLSVYPLALVHLLSRAGRRHDVVVDVVNGIPFGAPLVRRRGVVGLVHHVHREQWRIIYPGLYGRIGWWIESRVFPWIYRSVPVVTVSEASRLDLVALGLPAENVSVVHNGTPTLPAPTSSRSPLPTMCVLSRLVPHKRIEQAVDVLVELTPELPELRLTLVGEGWWRDHIERHVEAAGVVDRVELLGRVSEQQKVDALAESWVMVLPSVKEGWGIAILEAAATGTPTVAYRAAGGTRESVCHGVTGLLADDREELVAAVRRLLVDPDLRDRLGSAAQRNAVTYSWEATARAFEAKLAEACDRQAHLP